MLSVARKIYDLIRWTAYGLVKDLYLSIYLPGYASMSLGIPMSQVYFPNAK